MSSLAAVPHAAARPAVSCTRREGRAIARRTGPGPSIPGRDLAVHAPHSRCVHVSGGTLGGSHGCGQLRVNAHGRQAPPAVAAGGVAWPVRSGLVPPLAAGFITRTETVPGLEEALVPGAVVALVPGKTAGGVRDLAGVVR